MKLKLPYGTYEGEMLNGQPHGRGVLNYIDGAHYDGQFKNGCKHGFGFFRYANDEQFYNGEWYNDKKDGFGYFIFRNGYYYEGMFSKDMINGGGMLVINDAYYLGYFKNCAFVGDYIQYSNNMITEFRVISPNYCQSIRSYYMSQDGWNKLYENKMKEFKNRPYNYIHPGIALTPSQFLSYNLLQPNYHIEPAQQPKPKVNQQTQNNRPSLFEALLIDHILHQQRMQTKYPQSSQSNTSNSTNTSSGNSLNKSSKKYFDEYYNIAELSENAGNYSEAIKYYNIAKDYADDSFNRERCESRITTCQELIASQTLDQAKNIYNMGIDEMHYGNYSTAKDYFIEAQSLARNDYYFSQKCQEAIDRCNEMLYY